MSVKENKNIKTFEYTKIIGEENIEYGSNIIIDDFVLIYAKDKLKIGSYVHVAAFSSLVATAPVVLGDFSALSHGVRLFTATDDFKGHGFGNSTVDFDYRNVSTGPVEIGKFSVIGANSVILPGVTIGEGATVGAGSVVTRDLEPWGVYISNKKVADRDKEGVLKNYKRFLERNGKD